MRPMDLRARQCLRRFGLSKLSNGGSDVNEGYGRGPTSKSIDSRHVNSDRVPVSSTVHAAWSFFYTELNKEVRHSAEIGSVRRTEGPAILVESEGITDSAESILDDVVVAGTPIEEPHFR
jgi:hypothetical protein